MPQMICCQVNETGSAVTRRAGSGRLSLKSVLLQLVNILNTVKYWMGQMTFIAETFELWTKTVQSLIRCSWTFNSQLHVHLKKWTLKFKLLYTLSHIINYCNKIYRKCSVNTRIWRRKVWLSSLLPLLKYKSSSKGLFLSAHSILIAIHYKYIP